MSAKTKRNAEIVEMRMAGATYTKIAARFSLSVARVRQIYQRKLVEWRRVALDYRPELPEHVKATRRHTWPCQFASGLNGRYASCSCGRCPGAPR